MITFELNIRYKEANSGSNEFTCTYAFYMHISIAVNIHMGPSIKPEIDWKAVGRRLREIRGFEVNQAAFALDLGVSQGQLSRYEQGTSEIGAAVLLRVARKSGKTIEWLLTGKDNALKNP